MLFMVLLDLIIDNEKRGKKGEGREKLNQGN